MTTQDMITAAKTLHDEALTKTRDTIQAQRTHTYIDAARVSFTRAINQLMLHKTWNEDFTPPATAAAAPVVVAPTTAAPVIPIVPSQK